MAESCSLVETEGHTPLGWLDLTVLRVVWLVELAQVDAAVARRHAYVVRPANVVLQLDVDTLSHGLHSRVDVVNTLAQSRPSVTRKNVIRLKQYRTKYIYTAK